MKLESARKLAHEKLGQLAAELERGKSVTLKAYLAAMARFPRYSLHNMVLILSQRPTASQCAGLRAWNRLGRVVRKGERGIVILAPVVSRRRRDAEDGGRGEGVQPQDDTEEPVVAFRRVHVFDVSQTDGAPLPTPACVAGDPGAYLERLVSHAVERGIRVSYRDDLAGAHGVSLGGEVRLLAGLSPAATFATLVHELAHEFLHARGADSASRRTRETEAEAVAFVVSEAIGLDTSTAAADYIQLYQGDARLLAASLERVRSTAAELITAIGPDV